jgi:hypothetical protein
MIRKDLEDINKLKQSAFYETGKYSYGYPQAESIMNSVKMFEKDIHTHEPKMQSSQFREIQEMNSVRSQKVPEFKELKTIENEFETKNTAPTSQHNTEREPQREEVAPLKAMMKKNKENTVFTI